MGQGWAAWPCCLVAVLATVVLLPGVSGQSSCRIRLVGTGASPTGATATASAIRSASVQCTGANVAFTGPIALRGVATFSGATFTTAASAAGLLTYSAGGQLTIDQASVTNLNLGALSVLAVFNATLNVTQSTFSGNTIGDGSAVLLINSSDTTISGSTFTGNSATQFGGAVSVGMGTLVVRDSTFTGNSAGANGGAVSFQSVSGSTALLDNATFADNSAACRGGGVSFETVDSITVVGSTFSNNTVTQWPNSPTSGGACTSQYRFVYTAGDGLFADQFNIATINSSRFDRNGGNGDGGGMFLNGGITVTITDSNVTNSLQDNGRTGGVLVAATSTLVVDGCQFINNTGNSNGGLLAQQTNAVNITNSLFQNNQGTPNDQDNGFGGGLEVFSSCTDGCFVDSNTFNGNSVPRGDGGGFYAAAPATMIVSNNMFEDNSSGNTGGGMSVAGAGQGVTKNSLTVQNNIFRNNMVSGSVGTGGGMALSAMPSLTMLDSTFEGNTASKVGGGLGIVSISATTTSVTNCTFTGNTAPASSTAGGGMYMFGGAGSSVSASTFINNTVGGGGGGLYLSSVDAANVTGLTFTNNTSKEDSGGMHVDNMQTLDLESSVFSGNAVSAGNGGGLLVGIVANSTITNCTFSDNSASSSKGVGGTGGGLYSSALGTGNNGVFTTNALRVMNCNAQVDGGGGFFQGLDALVITNSNFTSNTAGRSGGGAALADNQKQSSTGSLFAFNTAENGGGMSVSNATTSIALASMTVRSNTASSTGGGLFLTDVASGIPSNLSMSQITNNTAGDFGGGVAFVQSPGSTLTISSSTVSNNKADQGAGLYGDNGVLFAATSLRQSGNAASTAATDNVGCADCTLSTNGGAAAGISNAPAYSTVSGMSVPGEPSGSGGGGISGGAIAGIVIGVLAGVALLAVAVWYLLRRRRRRRGDMEMARPKKGVEMPTSAVGQRNKVPSAFSDEGNGSFWSQPHTLNGSQSDLHSHQMDAPSSGGFNTDKTARTAVTYASNSSAPLINLHSGSVTSHGTHRTDVTFPDVPWSEWQIDARDIQVARRDDGREWKLGGGAFGEVYKAMLKGVNPVAVKVLRDQSYTSRDEFSREVALLKALHNSNIVQFQGACVEEDKMLLITEFMDGGDLFKAIARKQVSWKLRGRNIAIDVLRGLHFLHSKRIVHMDLKSPNILLTRHGVAKLADVGLAKVIRDRNYITQVSVIGTFAWAAPEVLTNEKCTEKADIFSFGIVLWEIVTGEQPVRGGRRDVKVPEECSQEVAEMIDACLQTDPDKRPTASAVLERFIAMEDPGDPDPDVMSL